MPCKVHHLVMMIYIFRPILGEKYKYMVLARYKYRKSMKLHLREGLLFYMHFYNHVGYVLIPIKHDTGRVTPRWIT